MLVFFAWSCWEIGIGEDGLDHMNTREGGLNEDTGSILRCSFISSPIGCIEGYFLNLISPQPLAGSRLFLKPVFFLNLPELNLVLLCSVSREQLCWRQTDQWTDIWNPKPFYIISLQYFIWVENKHERQKIKEGKSPSFQIDSELIL